MKYALITDFNWLNTSVPMEWPESHLRSDDNTQILDRFTYNQYLVTPSGKPVAKVVNNNGVAAHAVAFSRKGKALTDEQLEDVSTDGITWITESEWRELLSA